MLLPTDFRLPAFSTFVSIYFFFNCKVHFSGGKCPLEVTWSTPLFQQGHLEPTAQDHVQVTFEYLQQSRISPESPLLQAQQAQLYSNVTIFTQYNAQYIKPHCFILLTGLIKLSFHICVDITPLRLCEPWHTSCPTSGLSQIKSCLSRAVSSGQNSVTCTQSAE